MSEQQHEDPIRQAAAAMGRRGGAAGRGDAKRRSAEHYRNIGRKSGESRRLKRDAKTTA
jgi:general stress protein YciG